ncbi:cysteine protease ATG4C-like isoform X3 [Polyodon spathula]|uniref:cysteine protease ATG4C-like isoform X3 n=1 Tax=Polyodon spathula TaxID=7913 RepID=UPI001B7EE60C|nr:cysteine protease ATG4C-like isoform X3 [Polyodon spathula]
MENNERDEVEKLKSMFVSAWHNVQYSWILKTKTYFSRNSPVFLLGKCYHFKVEDWTWSHALKMDGLDTESWTASAARKLVSSFESSFQGPKPPESHTRAPGRVEEASTHLNCVYHRKIVSWFADCPTAQIGVHRLIELGHASGKSAGDWYGPAVVAHILGKAVKEATDPELQGITVYVAQDCTVYSADVIDSLQKPAQGPETETRVNRKAVIILIPVRLGGEKTNPEYFDFVKGILSLEYCIGIIGGKPKQAYYFVGFQDDSLIYMDPHYCQSFVDVSMNGFPLESFHCPSPKKMPFTKMDPSCTIGFYTRSVQDFAKISEEIAKVLKHSTKEKYPAFTFVKGHGRDYDYEQSESTSEGEPRYPKYSPGDFVLL